MVKDKNRSHSGDTYIIQKKYVYFLWAISYVVFSAALIYLAQKYNTPIDSCAGEKGIVDVLVEELGNAITITSGVVCALIDIITEKEKSIGVWTKRIVAISLFLLFNICRCANALKLTANLFSVLIFIFFLISTFLIIVVSNKDNVSKDVDNLKLKGMLGKIRNQNIVSIQLFDVEEVKEGEYNKYVFKYIDALCQDDNDINGMLCTTYKLKSEYVSAMTIVLLAYQKLIESGDETEKHILLSSINQNKENLLKILREINTVEEVNKEQCCIARMVILYITLEEMLQDANSVGFQAPDGILGLENVEIEKRLFSFIRTGILGTVFLGKNDIYNFNYWKDGSKIGRKYCAFQIHKDEKMLICMIVLRERKNNIVSHDILQAIKRIEKKLNDNWNDKKEMGAC